MNRADRLRLLAVAEAVADEVRASLRADAEQIFAEDGLAVSWTTDGISAVSSRSHDATAIADEDALLEWLVEHKPEWVKTVVVPVNPSQVQRFVKGLIREPDLGKVPGVALRKGGAYRALSITVGKEVKETLAKVAKDALDGGGIPDDLAALFVSRQHELEGGDE